MTLIQFKILVYRIKAFVLSLWPLSVIRTSKWIWAGAENRVGNVSQRSALCFDFFSVASMFHSTMGWKSLHRSGSKQVFGVIIKLAPSLSAK